jgi:ATP-dependent helicase/nuclease subunit A
MRILYVALTRAREKLILTGSRKENACMDLLRQSAAAGADLPDWMMADGNCHLEWLLMGLSGSRALHRLYATGAEPAAAQDPRFFALGVGRQQLEAATRRILQSKRSLKSLTAPSASALTASKAVFEQVQQNLQWRYPFENAVNISAKFSVSELVAMTARPIRRLPRARGDPRSRSPTARLNRCAGRRLGVSCAV